MGSCDLDRDLRPLPFLFLPMTSSFRCLAVARLSGSSRSNKHETAALGAERTAKIAFPFQSRILATTRRRFVFELKRIIDDDFRGRYLERELVARSPEAIQP